MNRENWIVLGLMVAVLFGSYRMIYRPQCLQLNRLRDELAAKKSVLETDMEKAAVIPQMIKQVQEMKTTYKDFDCRLPRSKELGGFLREISSIQEQSNLSGATMNTQNPVSGDLYNTMPITMRLKGKYLALAEFLKRMDTMARLTRVQRLMIQKAKSTDKGDLDIELLMNIYFTKN